MSSGRAIQKSAVISTVRSSIWIALFIHFAAPLWALRLEWASTNDPDVVTYRVYIGSTPRQYYIRVSVPAEVSSFNVPELDDGGLFYFAVTAVNKAGLESEFSEEVSATIPGLVVPQARFLSGLFVLDGRSRFPNDSVWIESSLDCRSWTVVGKALTGVDGSFVFIKTSFLHEPFGFFRVRHDDSPSPSEE